MELEIWKSDSNTSDVPARWSISVICGEILGQVISSNVLKINGKVSVSCFLKYSRRTVCSDWTERKQSFGYLD